MMGLFWKRATSKAAIIGVIGSIPVALLLKFEQVNLPFLNQIKYTCLITIAVIVMISLSTAKADEDPMTISMSSDMFKTDSKFNIAAYVVMSVLAILYILFWQTVLILK